MIKIFKKDKLMTEIKIEAIGKDNILLLFDNKIIMKNTRSKINSKIEVSIESIFNIEFLEAVNNDFGFILIVINNPITNAKLPKKIIFLKEQQINFEKIKNIIEERQKNKYIKNNEENKTLEKEGSESYRQLKQTDDSFNLVIGISIASLGIIMIIYFTFFFDVSVAVSSLGTYIPGIGTVGAFHEKVNNLGLMQDREIGIMLGSCIFVGGFFYLYLNKKNNKSENNMNNKRLSTLCIECGKYFDGVPNFCPNCGKKV